MAPHAHFLAAKEHVRYNSEGSNQILLSAKDQHILIVSCTLGAKSAIFLLC